jgi:signal transduction histidine kinase
VSATWSLRGRLTATVVGTTAAVLVALAVLLYAGVRHATWQQRDDAMLLRARAIAAIAEREDDGYEMPLPREAPGVPTYIEVWKPDGSVLTRSASLTGDLVRFGEQEPAFADVSLPDGREGRAIALRFVPRDDPRGDKLLLVIAEGNEGVDAAVASVRTWFLALAIGALVAIALLTAWLLGRGLRPLAQLATQIEQIDDRRLATRLPSAGQPRELEVPVHKLNDLLARLDASFVRERQFTADVSHELRTPLAGLRTLLEVTALADRSTVEYRKALADALEVTKQLGALVENLLTLARLDAGQLELDARDVPLRALVEECWRPHAGAAAARSIEFRNTVAAGAVTRTDREKLRIVVGNLLANAAEYTEQGGWIEVTSGRDGLLEVADSGPAIQPEQIERIFDRLWRGDAARAATGIHCGIGLSLARALCTQLSLTLTATSTSGRVSFRIA